MKRVFLCIMLALIVLAFGMASTAYATVYANKYNYFQPQDGKSWATGFRSIQAAIDSTATMPGEEIWVAAATYNEGLVLRDVKLYGGFAGWESSKDSRNPAANKTIIDAAGLSTSCARGRTITATIDGFTLKNGNGYVWDNYRYGAGIYVHDSTLTVENNNFENNYISGSGFGAGVCISYSAATIKNNSFLRCGTNSPTDGGGIAVITIPPDKNVTISGNTFKYCQSTYGGGIYASGSNQGSLLIANNLISECFAYVSGGGLLVTLSGDIINNTIVNNKCYSGNGCAEILGISTVANNIVAFNENGGFDVTSSVSLINNNVYGNTVYDYSSTQYKGATDISIDPIFVDQANANYHLHADSLCIDTGNDAYASSSWVDFDKQARIQGLHVDIGADETIPDTTIPTILSTDPEDGSVGVPFDKVFRVTFSENIKVGSNYDAITLKLGKTGVAFTKNITGKVLTITPSVKLSRSKTYTVTIPAGAITDLIGIPLAEARIFSFTTSTDGSSPSIISIDPPNRASNVPVDKAIIVTFSEDIRQGSTFTNIEVSSDVNGSWPVTRTITGNVLTIKPIYLLPRNTKWTVSIPADAVVDLAGNSCSAKSWSFTTVQ